MEINIIPTILHLITMLQLNNFRHENMQISHKINAHASKFFHFHDGNGQRSMSSNNPSNQYLHRDAVSSIILTDYAVQLERNQFFPYFTPTLHFFRNSRHGYESPFHVPPIKHTQNRTRLQSHVFF